MWPSLLISCPNKTLLANKLTLCTYAVRATQFHQYVSLGALTQQTFQNFWFSLSNMLSKYDLIISHKVLYNSALNWSSLQDRDRMQLGAQKHRCASPQPARAGTGRSPKNYVLCDRIVLCCPNVLSHTIYRINCFKPFKTAGFNQLL